MINELINNFLEDKKIFMSNETYKFYYYHCLSLKEYFNNKDINYKTICSYILNEKNKNNCNKTINKKIMILKSILKFNNIKNSDLDKIRKLKEKEKTFNFLTKQETINLLKYINKNDLSLKNRLIIRLFLDTGMRLNELINLKYNNIDISNNCIKLEITKTKKERYVFFTNDTKDNYLIPYIKENFHIINAPLFTCKKRTIQDLFYRIKKELKFKTFSPHMLRHTYATILINNNTNLEFIRITLGHSNLNTTKRYLHLNQETLFKTYESAFKIN